MRSMIETVYHIKTQKVIPIRVRVLIRYKVTRALQCGVGSEQRNVAPEILRRPLYRGKIILRLGGSLTHRSVFSE